MKSLAARHAEREQRKVDNAAFSDGNDAAIALSSAYSSIGAAADAYTNLNKENREAFKKRFSEVFSEIENDDDTYSAYDENGNLKSAGIGVINPEIVPSSIAATGDLSSKNAAGWGDPPAPTLSPKDGNQNGAALAKAEAEAGNNSWGDASQAGKPDEMLVPETDEEKATREATEATEAAKSSK